MRKTNMPGRKKKQHTVEEWELWDPNAPEDEAGEQAQESAPDIDAPKNKLKEAKKAEKAARKGEKAAKRAKKEEAPQDSEARGEAYPEESGAKHAGEEYTQDEYAEEEYPEEVPSDEEYPEAEEISEEQEAPAKNKTKSKALKKKAKKKKKERPQEDEEDDSDEPVKLIDLVPKALLPKRFKLSEKELKAEKKRKAKRKKQEAEFKKARKQLQKRRKAAKKAMARRDKGKKQSPDKPRQRRGFFRSLWAIFDWFYVKTTNPEEKENRLKPKIFGRTLTYTGFMVLMALLIVVVFLVLNNRTVGVEREQIIVTGLSDDFKGYNILVISDLNGKTFGEDQGTLQRLLSSESYSLVLMLGDMVGSGGDTEAFYDLIDLFTSQRKPVYFIAGDSDPAPRLDTPRAAGEGRTWREMVLSDWVLGAIEHGATYVDCPMSITRGSTRLWLVPDDFLNLNVGDALNEYKDVYAQEQDAYLVGVEAAKLTLPLTYYRRNLLDKTRDLIVNSVRDGDIIVMLSHEVPSDSQLNVAQSAKSETQRKNYLPAPDIVFAGHYCGGEWKLPLIGTLYVDSSILSRYGWFPAESYVQGQRSVGGTVVYTTQGLGNNSQTIFRGRLNNPPRVALITLTGELPSSFLE